MSPSFKDKIALVTGASRGIGAAVAQQLAAQGAHVLLVARTLKDLEAIDDLIQAQGGSCSIVQLDLREGDKIDQLGGIIAERYGKLDILVGNAGVLGVSSPVGHIKPKVWDEVIATNITANWRLLRSFDPLLRKSEAGRVIFVTNETACTPKPYFAALAASKAALEQLAKTYAQEVKHSNVKVNLIDPGIVNSHFRGQFMPGEDKDSLPQPKDVTEQFLALASAECTDTGKVVRIDPVVSD